jgi:hypothetical protein
MSVASIGRPATQPGFGRSHPTITFGMIVLDGMPFLPYNLRALYPFAHQIIVVEGASPGAAVIAGPVALSRMSQRAGPGPESSVLSGAYARAPSRAGCLAR